MHTEMGPGCIDTLNQGGSLFHQQGKGKPCPYMLATLIQGGSLFQVFQV
jgi:hypothetical protein